MSKFMDKVQAGALDLALDYVLKSPSKNFSTLDFWNNSEYSQVCLAGGKVYLHINANGDYEPCAFIHYSDSNIHEETLLEALQAPLFKAYQAGQPWNKNYMRPCPLLDNPDALISDVEASDAHSTDLQNPEDVRDLAAKCEKSAERWAPMADELWSCSHSCVNCNGCGSERMSGL